MQTIDRYNKLILSKLPEEISKELEEIKSSTNNFQDEELMKIFQDNFNELYEIIEKKHPEAIKPKKKILAPDKPKMKAPGKIKPGKKEQKPEVDCEEAVEKLEEIEKKKEQAAAKRAKTIQKKKRSVIIKERIGKVFASIKKADKENKFTEQIEQLEKFHVATTAHLLRYIRKNDTSGIEKLVKVAVEESKT